MKAVAKTRREPGLEVIETEPDHVGENQVLLKMKSASICGSDLGFYDYTPAYQKFAKVPTIMGHEFAGVIENVGAQVENFSMGDRVACESVIYCGRCKFCRMGMTNICQNFTVFGMHRNGGFAELVSLDPKFLHKVPKDVDDIEAGIVEPLSVIVNALDDVGEIRIGQTASIIGPGPLGLFSAEVLRSKGISDITIIGVSIDEYRLRIAKERLAFRAVNSDKENPMDLVMSSTGGYGNDVVVVSAGAPAALQSAFSLVAKGGQIIILGIFPTEVSLQASDLVRRQVSMRGSYGSRWEHYEKAISLLEGKKVRTKEIVTHRFPIEKADEAFRMAKSKMGSKVQLYA